MESASAGEFDWRLVPVAAAIVAAGIVLRELVGNWITLALSAVGGVAVLVAGREWERRFLLTAIAAVGVVVVIVFVAVGLSAL